MGCQPEKPGLYWFGFLWAPPAVQGNRGPARGPWTRKPEDCRGMRELREKIVIWTYEIMDVLQSFLEAEPKKIPKGLLVEWRDADAS